MYKDKNCYPIKIRFDNEFSGNFESSTLHINDLIENKFRFKAYANGLKLFFQFHIDFVEPKETIGGIMKFKENK